MSIKKKLTIVSGIALSVGLGVAGKKIATDGLNKTEENDRLKEKIADMEEEIAYLSEGGDTEMAIEWEELEEDSFSLDFINHAPKSELIKIQGIGNALSTKLIENRPYLDFKDVKEKVDRVPELLFELEGLDE